MANAASTKILAGNVPSISVAPHISPHSAPTSPTTNNFRTRTVSSSAFTKKPDGNSATDDPQDTNPASFPVSSLHDQSQMNLNEASRARRSSTTTSGVHFSIPKTLIISSPLGFFSRRRRSMQQPPQRPSDDTLGEVLEIGPDLGRVEGDANAIKEDEERDRLRDAAAQALGLGFGRDSSGTPEPTPEDSEVAETPATDQSINPYVLDPIPRIPPLLTGLTPSPPSLISLPNSHSQLAPSIMNTIPGSSDTVPPYPSTLSALKPYIQTSSSLLKYHPASTFLALTLNRRAKQWKLHYVVLTSPPPATSTTHDSLSSRHTDLTHRPHAEMQQLRADVLQTSNGDFLPLPSTRSSHLHLFKSAAPAPEDMEVNRLEINEDSVVYVAEMDIGGKRDVVKVGGRDARKKNNIGSGGASFKSTGSSWHRGMKGGSEGNAEEMGRTMWLLKMVDGPEMQRWIGHIKTVVFTQRAERAGMTFRPHPPNSVPSMRADLDMLLSLRSQALLPSVAVSSDMTMPSYPRYTSPSTDTISQVIPAYTSQAPSSQVSPQKPPSSFSHTPITNTATRASSPTPNPRYAEHVGAAPSYTSPASLRARTYPTPSALNHGLPSLKSLFSPTSTPSGSGFGHGSGSSSGKRASSSRQGSRPSSPQHDNEKDIDPISDDVVSLGHRAAALLNLFRSSSRASNSYNQHTNMSNYSTPPPPASTTRSYGIGTPISPELYSDKTVRGTSSGVGAQSTAFSVDWSMMDDSGHGSAAGSLNKQTSSGTPSLPPPPRNPRRPIVNSIIRGNVVETTTRNLQVNGTAHADGGSPLKRRSASPGSPHTPSPPVVSIPASAPSIPGSSGFRGGRPPSATNSTSSYASAEGDRSSEVERGNSMRRSRTVPKMLAPPNGPPPSAPSLRARPPSGPPSPIFEQDVMQRNGSGRHEASSSATSTWGSQHPYSNRVSSNSAMSVKTNSTGHSFLGSKAPPPPRPPPNFFPPPAPTDVQDSVVPTSANRESFISRSLRLSLVPPAGAPPTQSLPPRPDEPGYRHRRSHSNEVKSTNNLSPIPASPTPSSFVTHPSAPPPNGPLPPTPDNDTDRPSSRDSRHTSLTHRLRVLSSPSPTLLTQTLAKDVMVDTHRRLIGEPILSHSDGYPPMFLNMSDTPITPAMSHPPNFLSVPSPLQPEEDDVGPTPLSPPPRRNSRNSKEIRVSNHEKDDTKLSATSGAPMSPQDSAVVLHR